MQPGLRLYRWYGYRGQVKPQGNARRFVVRNGSGGRELNTTYTVEDRQVRSAVRGGTQRAMGFTDFAPNNRSMTYADTLNYISYLGRTMDGADNSADTWNTRGPQQINSGTKQTGRVNIQSYMEWLPPMGTVLRVMLAIARRGKFKVCTHSTHL